MNLGDTPLLPERSGYYWCARDSAGKPWRVGARVGAKTFGNGVSVTEAEYAAKLNAVAPLAVDNRCLSGAEIVEGAWEWKRGPGEFDAPSEHV